MKFRRMTRLTFGLAAAASLLLCVVVAVGWARSYCVGLNFSRIDAWSVGDPADARIVIRHQFVSMTWGLIILNETSSEVDWHGDRAQADQTITTVTDQEDGLRTFPAKRVSMASVTAGHEVANLGLARYARQRSGSLSSRRVVVPCWAALAVTGTLPAVWAGRWWRRRRGRLRRAVAVGAEPCRGCAYDLRASPERCPECGAMRVSAVDAAGEAPEGLRTSS